VGVPIEGELDRGVSGEMLDVLRVRATSKQDRQAGMPEIVPVYIGQTGSLQERLEVAVDNVLGVEGSALARGEHKPVVLPFCARPKLSWSPTS
jgi:hypothetical protein